MVTIKSNSNCLYVWVPLGPLEKITHKEVTLFEFLFFIKWTTWAKECHMLFILKESYIHLTIFFLQSNLENYSSTIVEGVIAYIFMTVVFPDEVREWWLMYLWNWWLFSPFFPLPPAQLYTEEHYVCNAAWWLLLYWGKTYNETAWQVSRYLPLKWCPNDNPLCSKRCH